MAQTVEYDPWGKVSREEGIGDSVRRFTGKQLDPESGLYYYGGRYYDPELGRFISPDPFVPQPGDPQSFNRYSYVGNNPVNYIDPSGFKKKKKGGFFRKFFGAIVGAIVGIVSWGLGAPAMLAGAIGGATAGAVNTAINGGNPVANILGGALLGGIAGGIGPPLAGAFSGALGGLGGAIAAGAVTGAVVGAVSTAIHGGNFGQNVGFGALGGAVTAAAIYGGYKAWQLLSRGAEAAQFGSGLGKDITDSPFISDAIKSYESFTQENLTGLRVHLGGTDAMGEVLNANTVALNKGVFGYPIEEQYLTLGHEFKHVTQIRTTSFFQVRYGLNNLIYGYYNNPYEVAAERTGAAFATHVLRRPIPPNELYGR